MSQSVIPLESNPEIFTQFAHKLGLSQSFIFHDVYSITDKDLLSFIPRPSPAVILLFPITEAYEKARLEEESKNSPNTEIVWFKQTVKNACGLYALLNSISNLDETSYEPNSRVVEFKKSYKDITQVEKLVENLKKDYTEAATSGETEAPDAEEDTTLHFITFIKQNGHVYEMDGRRKGPLDLGEAEDKDSEDVLGEPAVANRFQRYIELSDDENKLNFSLIALAPSFD